MSVTRTFTIQEINRIRHTFSGKYHERDRLLFEVLLHTGMRISEAITLQFDDIYDQSFSPRETITISSLKKRKKRKLKRVLGSRKGQPLYIFETSKTYHSKAFYRSLPVSISLSKILSQFIKNNLTLILGSSIFYSQKKGHIQRRQAHRILKNAFHSADIDTSSHSCRKTFSSYFLESGGNIFELSKLLGHETIQTTALYPAFNEIRIRKTVDSFPFNLIIQMDIFT